MTNTNFTIRLEPGQWNLVAPRRSQLVNLHVKKQASLRLHLFSSPKVNAPPPANTTDYTVIQNHLPAAPVMEPYHHDPAVFLMPDGDEPVTVTASVAQPDPQKLELLPLPGKLPAGKVNVLYNGDAVFLPGNSTTFGVWYGDNYPLRIPCVFDIVDGTLPPGLTLETRFPDPIHWEAGFGTNARISGTPTQSGEFFFTVRASIDPEWDYPDYSGEVGRAIFSITIGSPA